MTQNLQQIIKDSGAKAGDVFVFEKYISIYNGSILTWHFQKGIYENLCSIIEFKLLSIWRPTEQFFNPEQWEPEYIDTIKCIKEFSFKCIWHTPKEDKPVDKLEELEKRIKGLERTIEVHLRRCLNI